MASKLGKLLVVVLACMPVYAATTGAISGFIKNVSGTPQMGATVQISTSAMLLGTTVFTDARGFYSAHDLPAGTYQVKVSAAAFLPALRENVTLRAGSRLMVNLTLNTLEDAIGLIPSRRSPDADPDDWHWTLRSTSNRPVLRVFEGGPLVVENAETPSDRDLKASVAFIAGADGDNFGGSEVSTAFSLEKSLFTSGLFSVNGNIGNSPGETSSGVIRASYSHDFGTGSRPQLAVIYRYSPGLAIQNSAYSAVSTIGSDSMTIANFIDLKYGAELDALQVARHVEAFRPFGAIDVHLSPNMVLEYRYATSEPNSRNNRGFAVGPADLTESGPRMTLSDGTPDLERARHQEISIARRFGKSNVQVAYYVDQINHIVLSGVGEPASGSDNVLPDVYSGTFSYSGGDINTSGLRVVLEHKFSDDLTATADYATGGVVTLKTPGTALDSIGSDLLEKQQYSLGAKISGRLPRCHASLAASYKWSAAALSTVDAFNASAGQMDPYLSLYIRQPLPSTSFIPARMEALLDVRNLLSQGYLPVLGQDGRTLYLVQSARTIRAGLAFTF